MKYLAILATCVTMRKLWLLCVLWSVAGAGARPPMPGRISILQAEGARVQVVYR
jgi:hypothetical protein